MVEHVKNPNLDGLTELAHRDGVESSQPCCG